LQPQEGLRLKPEPRATLILGLLVLAAATSGVAALVTPDGGALLYVDGRTPEGGNTKILWRTNRDASGLLVLRGTQLDGNGTFRQTFQEVGPSGHWPSIPVVPNTGCWLLTARISGPRPAAGILVVRVV
jgi:hypothetical protein